MANYLIKHTLIMNSFASYATDNGYKHDFIHSERLVADLYGKNLRIEHALVLELIYQLPSPRPHQTIVAQGSTMIRSTDSTYWRESSVSFIVRSKVRLRASGIL